MEREKEEGEGEEFVYRISTLKEWEALQRDGHTYGGELDKSTGCFHLSKLSQVQSTLQNFFLNFKDDLYLLQIDAKKLGDGLVYEVVDGVNSFPHYYGPSRTFSPLPSEAVTKAEKLSLSGGELVLRSHITPMLKSTELDASGSRTGSKLRDATVFFV